jgi:hypothetical protein
MATASKSTAPQARKWRPNQRARSLALPRPDYEQLTFGHVGRDFRLSFTSGEVWSSFASARLKYRGLRPTFFNMRAGGCVAKVLKLGHSPRVCALFNVLQRAMGVSVAKVPHGSDTGFLELRYSPRVCA